VKLSQKWCYSNAFEHSRFGACYVALQPVTKLQAGTSPVILKQQQVVVQQMAPQSYIKSGAQSIAGGTHIQHIITSLPLTASASSAVSSSSLLTAQTTTVAVTAPQVTFTKTLSLTITTTAMPTSKSLILRHSHWP